MLSQLMNQRSHPVNPGSGAEGHHDDDDDVARWTSQPSSTLIAELLQITSESVTSPYVCYVLRRSSRLGPGPSPSFHPPTPNFATDTGGKIAPKKVAD